MGKNGKIRPGYALVDGVAEFLPEGHYVLRTYEGPRTVYTSVGPDAAEALAERQRRARRAVVLAEAEAVGIEVVAPSASRVHLATKCDEYIKRHLSKGQQRASETSKIAIQDYLDATGIIYADQVNEASVLKFYSYLRKSGSKVKPLPRKAAPKRKPAVKKPTVKAGNQDRTIYNKHVSLFGFFKWLGLDTKELSERAPSYTKKEVSVYDSADLKKLFAASPPYQRLVYRTLYKTGMRMQEGMNLEWPRVDFRRKKIRVREILDTDDVDDVRIKDWEERSIPLPDDLAAELRAWRESHPATRLVLGTKNDTPNWKWLQMLKRSARAAGLNCGRCAGCRKTQECQWWTIKRFRSTYTTSLLRKVDPITVMAWTGHKDLATVMLYAAADKSDEAMDTVNAIDWA
jgi:integrase